jgi:hypothetical protein
VDGEAESLAKDDEWRAIDDKRRSRGMKMERLLDTISKAFFCFFTDINHFEVAVGVALKQSI